MNTFCGIMCILGSIAIILLLVLIITIVIINRSKPKCLTCPYRLKATNETISCRNCRYFFSGTSSELGYGNFCKKHGADIPVDPNKYCLQFKEELGYEDYLL